MTERTFERANPWAAGISIFAGAVLLSIGLMQLVQGIAAVANSEVFISLPNYVYELDLTSWGWIHIVVGLLGGVVGVGILAGQGWAMYGGLAVAVLAIAANFAWMPFQPAWSVLVIIFSGFAIWALASVLGSNGGGLDG